MSYLPVPYRFQARTNPLPLSELDADLAYVKEFIYYVEDYYYDASGNRTLTDDAAFDGVAVAVAATGGTVVLKQNKTYNLWATTDRVIFQLNNSRPVKIEGNGATIQSMSTAAPSNCYFVINQDNGQGLMVENLTFRGTSYTGGIPLLTVVGEHFVNFGINCRNIYVTNCAVFNAQVGVQCLAEAAVCRNVHVTNCYFERVYYPLSLWCTQDVFARIATKECGRSYFPVSSGGFNCANHDVTVHSESGYTSVDCLFWLNCKAGFTTEMTNMKLNYFTNGRAVGAGGQSDAMVYFDMRQFDGSSATGKFQNIDVNFWVNGANAAGALADPPTNLLQLVKRLANGAGDPTPRGHIVNGLAVRGTAINWNNASGNGIILCDTLGGVANWTGDFVTGLKLQDIQMAGVPVGVNTLIVNGQGAITTTPFLTVDNVYLEGNVSYVNLLTTGNVAESNFKAGNLNAMNHAYRAYTPVWASSGAGLNKGSSSITGQSEKVGRKVTARGSLSIDTGGGFNPGAAGNYTITLPYPVSANQIIATGLVYGFDSGTSHYRGLCRAVPGGNTMAFYLQDTSGTFGLNSPFILATGDFFQWEISYMTEG